LHSAEPIRKDDLGSSFPSRTSTTIGPDIFWPCGRSVAGSPFSTARTGLASGWCHCLVESPGAPRLPSVSRRYPGSASPGCAAPRLRRAHRTNHELVRRPHS
jgi:hypothetical protein